MKPSPCIIISNHPTGLADGMAVFQAIRDKRPDHLYLANADALRVMPKGDDIIIPVEWVAEKRTLAKTKQTLLETKAALDFKLTFGEPIAPQSLPKNADKATDVIRAVVEAL